VFVVDEIIENEELKADGNSECVIFDGAVLIMKMHTAELTNERVKRRRNALSRIREKRCILWS
jgi:hypothetical protein